MTLNDDVLIAVDPHKASNTAAVLDPVTKMVSRWPCSPAPSTAMGS
jgi:hypothetical protein